MTASAGVTGSYNIGIGHTALQDITSSEKNVAVGYNALANLTTGNRNVAIGQQAGEYATTAFGNVIVGSSAASAGLTGSSNVLVGISSAGALTSGTDNVFVGSTAGSQTTTADDNVFVGAYAGTFNTTGHSNTFIGYRAAADDETTSAGTNVTTGSNLTNIGFKARASSSTATNQVTLGNSSISSLRCQVQTISSLSDARDKTDITPLQAGLDFVERLDPVSFTWNMRDGGKVGIEETGFIAQDLQQVQQDTGVEIPGLVSDDNPERLEAAYGKLVPVLVQAIKDLSAKVNELEAQINS